MSWNKRGKSLPEDPSRSHAQLPPNLAGREPSRNSGTLLPISTSLPKSRRPDSRDGSTQTPLPLVLNRIVVILPSDMVGKNPGKIWGCGVTGPSIKTGLGFHQYHKTPPRMIARLLPPSRRHTASTTDLVLRFYTTARPLQPSSPVILIH
jgi:hypothetical protein